MKSKIIITASAIVASSALGTIVNPANVVTGNLATDLPVADNTGALIANGSGSIAVGNYAPGAAFATATNVADFLTGFRQFGSVVTFNNAVGSPAGFFNGSMVSFQEDSANTTDLTDTNLPIFVVIGNESTLMDSTQFAVWESSAVFMPDAAGQEGQSSAVVGIGSGDLRFGTLVTDVVAQAGGNSLTFENGIQLATLVPVPEPSSSLLIGLAGLMLAGRRRR